MATVVPYKDQTSSKKEQVAEMFDNISHRYDFLNRVLSIGIDKRWRKKAVKMIEPHNRGKLLDIATGTGDFAITALRINPDHVTGIDISEGMLEYGKEKIKDRKLENKILLQYGDSENIEFPDATFNAITVGFGVRNFQNLEKGLSEMHRVLQNKGQAVILEFSKPRSFPFKQLYNFYFFRILPRIGKWISKDDAAYTYLPESVDAFPEGQEFIDILKKMGFESVKEKRCLFGIATIYNATK